MYLQSILHLKCTADTLSLVLHKIIHYTRSFIFLLEKTLQMLPPGKFPPHTRANLWNPERNRHMKYCKNMAICCTNQFESNTHRKNLRSHLNMTAVRHRSSCELDAQEHPALPTVLSCKMGICIYFTISTGVVSKGFYWGRGESGQMAKKEEVYSELTSIL